MDQNSVGKLLPNLKISLGDETDSKNLIEEGELSDIDNSESGFSTAENSIKIVRTWMKTFENPKVYENKDGGFITGLDLSSEVLIKKLQKRAERFGLEKKAEPITQNEIDALYESLGIEPENLKSCKLKNIRLEALHMRGVEEMNTNEIFSYFGDFGPASVEWINDFSCNVLWLDASTTARAMIGMSQPFIIKKKAALTKDEKRCSEDAIEISDSEESNDKKDDFDEEAMDIDLSDTEKPDDYEAKNDSSEIDVPVPPGYWRLGVSHPKSKAILLRFATKDDRKLPGAEKRSQYYQKYGNPNYGGLKGIISSSRKRKIQAARNRQVVEKFAEDSTSQLDMHSGETSKGIVTKTSRNKMPRMRMYADDEEEKKRTSSFMDHKSGRRSVHSRLGLKYTKNELAHLGSRFSSESEDDGNDNISINCKVPSRFNVWTDIAKDMAKEDNYRPRSSSSDYELFRNKRSRNTSTIVRERRSPESIRDSRPWRARQNYRPRSSSSDYEACGKKRSRNTSTIVRDRRSPESTRKSKPWRPRENYRPRSNSSVYEAFGKRRSRNTSTIVRDRRSPESTGDSRPWRPRQSYRPRSNSPDKELFSLKRSQNTSTVDYDRSSPESTQGSRPWRPSRSESTEDLRTSLSSQRRHHAMKKTREDLRSKIKKVKKEEDVKKHRSPMFLNA